MYKCVQDGKSTYQAEPCPSSAKQDTLKTKANTPASASASAAASTSAADGSEVNRAIEFMSSYRACADAIQIWGAEMGPLYDVWRSHNIEMVTRIEKNPQHQALFQQRVNTKRNGRASMCREVALELRGISKK